MPIRLNSFTSEILNQNSFTREGGLAKSSHFEVLIDVPNVLTSLSPTSRASDVLSLRCDSISFPSRAPLTTDIKHFGPISKRVYGYDAAPVTATFILSQNMFERELMLQWQDLSVGSARIEENGMGNAGAFLTGYYSDYTHPIQIIKYNESGFETHRTTLYEAFPQFVGEVGVDWGTDDFLKVNVTFAYRFFADKPKGTIGETNPALISLFKAALNGNLEREAREIANEEIDVRSRDFVSKIF